MGSQGLLTEMAAARINASIVAAETEAGKKFETFTRSDFLEYFYSNAPFSPTAYYEARVYAVKYLEAIGADDAKQTILSISWEDRNYAVVFRKKFFVNFDSFYDTLRQRIIDKVGRMYQSSYDTLVAALILAWVGVDGKSAVNVLKSDVTKGVNTLSVDGRDYSVPERGMAFLNDYAESLSFTKQMGRGPAEHFYKPSAYLLRTGKSDKMSFANIASNLTSAFNSSDEERTYAYSDVRLSGIFYRVYLYEMENGLLEKPSHGTHPVIRDTLIKTMEALFDEKFTNTSMAYRRLKQYQSYRDYFYPGMIK